MRYDSGPSTALLKQMSQAGRLSCDRPNYTGKDFEGTNSTDGRETDVFVAKHSYVDYTGSHRDP